MNRNADMFTKRNNYYWVEWQGKFLGDLLTEFPQVVLGKYLVNTSFDSGTLTLSPEEIRQGWRKYDELAVSPHITDIESIPYDQYDEWYVFASPITFDDYEVFVNYGGFSLNSPAFGELQEQFWRQLERLAPASFLADGDNLICATRDMNLFNQLSQWGDEEREVFG